MIVNMAQAETKETKKDTLQPSLEPRHASLVKSPRDESVRLEKLMAEVWLREQQHERFSDGLLLEESSGAAVFKGETLDLRLKVLMDSLEQLHKAIMAGDQSPCADTRIRVTGGERSMPAYKLTRVGRKVYTCCKLFLTTGGQRDEWWQAYDDHLFNPTMTVMLRAMRRWSNDVAYWLEANEPVARDSSDAVAVLALIRLVKFVRRVCGTWAFKNEWANYARKAVTNFNSARDYVIGLFELRSRLLVLRVDLYLRPEAKSWGYGLEAEIASKKFLRWLRERRDVGGYLGYIVKRENGIHRGMHWHWMVFLDGHQHRDACSLTKMLGQTWERIVGQGRGSYFNCYARKDQYRFNGLGLVHARDREKLLGIRAALYYMTKRDCVLRTGNGKQQDFRRSKPRDSPRVRRGAPRKNDDKLASVKRLLGGVRSKYPPSFEP